MHFCMDEFMAIVAMLTGGKMLGKWILMKWHARRAKHTCCATPHEAKSTVSIVG